ncbi:protein scabrous [Drosophila guanche]|uniref:Blast:Protein scabrous n=1 Tax=Drosophila guanche TaxID=7266 RepID=A0A3B0J2W6_DROGU|nr:protein scabrous [Drosophila guanche]SPP75607.1 blast:Protein scabrous [Drosophila guanche]
MPATNILRLILLAAALSRPVVAAATAGVVLSDVNNMLRDAARTTSENPQKAKDRKEQTVPSSVELLRFVEDAEEGVESEDESLSSLEMLSSGQTLPQTAQHTTASFKLDDQVRLLSKQLNALIMRRREDYEMLEHNLRKSLRLTTDAASADADMRTELNKLREEVASLRGSQGSNKERLTVEWLQQAISEIRKQLAELQHTAGNVAKDVQQRSAGYEDLATIRNDFQQIKLELAAQHERQQQTEVLVQELREEMLQQEEDYQHALSRHQKLNPQPNSASIEEESSSSSSTSSQELSGSSSSSNVALADHKRRHCRFQSQQIHALQQAHRGLRRQVNELRFHHIDERVRGLEVEQHRIANANFNLSSQIASLDKLHTSMLELLEDVEGLQTKMDKSIPELRHEISKLEFANAQITSEQSLVREEGKNAARSLQAMAVSVSVLQDERNGIRKLVSTVESLQTNVDRLQSLVNDELKNKLSHLNKPHKRPHHQLQQQHQQLQQEASIDSALAETLVSELENVEAQYEAIINKLPHDCSEVHTQADGLHLIAPAGQHHPLMSHCTADGWTTVQRRFDGSADFNRTWADYAHGFGKPGGEFWIGNEQLHHLTLDNCSRLRVQMQDIYDNVWVAEYARFYISSRADGFRLQIGEYSGNASDALNYQQGMQFSAIDDDRDISQTHCAANYEGGWWFSHCQHANLNGRYNLGLTWFDAARNEWIAVKSSRMLVKRVPAAECQAAATSAAGAAPFATSATSTTNPEAVSVALAASTSTPSTVVQFIAAGQA